MTFDQSYDFRELYSQRDRYYWSKVNDLINTHGVSIEFILKHYMAFVQRRELPQLLAYYELFKMVRHLPGSIGEVGVFVGNGLFTWAKLMETYFPGMISGKLKTNFDPPWD